MAGYRAPSPGPVFARILLVPASRDDLGPFYRDVIAVDPLEPYGAASAGYRLEVLARTLSFPVRGARLVPSNNNDVWRLDAGYLRVAWRGDRSRLAREAELLERLRGGLPVPEVLDRGGDDRLSWSLTAAMPGTAYEHLCVQPAPAGLRDLVREVAALLRALHSWSVPGELAEMLKRPGTDPDPLHRAGSELVLPTSQALRLIPLAGQLPFVDHGVLDAAAARLADLADPVTAGGEVVLHGDLYLGNVLVHGGHVSALIDFEFSRMGPPDLELISVVRALDGERRLGLQRPPLLAWLAEDYPELFAVPDLDRRLWQYALAYTIRQIIFWPPDRAEADGLELTHPLHTLRRLIDAPLPLPAGGLPPEPGHEGHSPASGHTRSPTASPPMRSELANIFTKTRPLSVPASCPVTVKFALCQ
jgi:aminoglycoside phosphotransferase (APT) family kinase protein